MFAILISEENLEKIAETELIAGDPRETLGMYFGRTRDWYFVQGYYTERPSSVTVMSWTVLPEFVLKGYEYDPDKIKTDWDQIVRK